MDKLSSVEVDFIVEGREFDLDYFTKKIGLVPTEVRRPDDWPQLVKSNLNIPKELYPRYEWCISQKEESCKHISEPINKIKSLLTGKEKKLKEFCETYNLSLTLSIVINAEIMNLPEMVLPQEIVCYFGNLKAEIGFDIYVY